MLSITIESVVTLSYMVDYKYSGNIVCHILIIDLHSGAPIITSVTYRLEKSSSDLTCNSITSPPTTVTWIIGDAMFTLRDGESVTINRVKYELKQTVTNRRTSAYASTLTIHTVLAEDITGYRSTVNNTLGGDSKAVGEGSEF